MLTFIECLHFFNLATTYLLFVLMIFCQKTKKAPPDVVSSDASLHALYPYFISAVPAQNTTNAITVLVVV
jgi:hypothetical protein